MRVVDAARRTYPLRNDTGVSVKAASLSLLRAKPSKDGDAEPRDYSDVIAKSAEPPA
jgi:hypothetical protein